MKRALILHAIDRDSNSHWYPWLKQELEKFGYEVWAPDLPNADHPSNEEVAKILLDSKWDFQDSLVIGHSSGSMQALYFLQSLPGGVIVGATVCVSSFDRPVPGMEEKQTGLFNKPYDFRKISTSTKKLLFVHSDDDPWCPLAGAENLSKQTGGELIVVPNGGHFSTSLDPRFSEFPELLTLLQERNILSS